MDNGYKQRGREVERDKARQWVDIETKIYTERERHAERVDIET